MKSKASRHAVYGTLIAAVALITANLSSCFFQFGNISLTHLVHVQKNNATLWFMNAMPFIFAFWGQYASSKIAREAGSMIMEQTRELKDLNEALEYKAAYEATHDSTTGLPNRMLLMDRMEQAVQSGLRLGIPLAFLILDIDDFKKVNDTLGHYSGDSLLKKVASSLKGTLRDSDTLARIGPDEFGILIQTKTDPESIDQIRKKIQRIFFQPFVIEGLSIEVQVSMGIAFFPKHGKEAETIMQRASVAVYSARQDRNKFTVYSEKLDKNSPHRLTMVGELRQAIQNDELILYYQPKIDLQKWQVLGVEALVRWQHPEHGFMPPDEFIPMAERTGLIRPLSVWMLNHALSQAEIWHKKDIKISVAVNFSPVTFLDTELPNQIIGMLSLYEVPAKYVTFEITEGSMLKDPAMAMEIMNRLVEAGIKISIDDFGTGYSSLAYFKNLPVQEVKIDKSFVSDMLTNERDNVIVKSIIDLGHNLGMRVVAEGVENKETMIALKQMGCDVLQGYYVSRPVSSGDFMDWISSS